MTKLRKANSENLFEIMKEEIKKIFMKIENLEKRLKLLEDTLISGEKESSMKGISIKDFFDQKGPANETLKTLTAGYYLEKVEKLDSFNIEDLKMAYKLAKEIPPKNLNDSIYRNLRKKHMIETNKKEGYKSWVLTRYGERFIESNFTK